MYSVQSVKNHEFLHIVGFCSSGFLHYESASNVMVYCVIAKMETMPVINAKSFIHLCSECSHSSGITSVAPTYTKVPATIANMIQSTTGEANSFTAIPIVRPIGPMALKMERYFMISFCGMPDLTKATRSAMDSAGLECDDYVKIQESVNENMRVKI
jgi:hypothetical protein